MMKLLLNVMLLLKKHMLLKPSMAVALVSVAATQAVNMAAQLSELPEAMVRELRLPDPIGWCSVLPPIIAEDVFLMNHSGDLTAKCYPSLLF